MIRLCFATNNQHKIREVKAAIPSSIELLSLEDIQCFEELPETSDTLEGNSLQKAAYVLQHYGVPCFADDTGLEVDALNGAPGVYSARFAGPEKDSDANIEALLSRMNDMTDRSAQFRTIFTLVGLQKNPIYFEGVVRGSITRSRRGTSGFGYDPVFQPDGHQYTFAEMDLAQKNTLSHRAIAVQKLSQFLLRNKIN